MPIKQKILTNSILFAKHIARFISNSKFIIHKYELIENQKYIIHYYKQRDRNMFIKEAKEIYKDENIINSFTNKDLALIGRLVSKEIIIKKQQYDNFI